jgi:TraM recognition site of TraD and TraG
MKKLPEYATTVCGRNISILLSAQSRSQLDAEYGLYKANVLRGQMDTIVIHRPAPDDYETMAHIERILGPTSGFAHSKSEHEGGVAHETDLIDQTQVIIKRSGIRPVLAERLDWRRFPELEKRHGMAPPRVSPLPAFEQHFTKGQEYALAPTSSWQLSPELTRRGRPLFYGGLSKQGRGACGHPANRKLHAS